MKKRAWIWLCAFLIWIMPLSVQAAESIDGETRFYAAATQEQKDAQLAQVQEMEAALQKTADMAGPLTAGSNVQVKNYSDPENGIVHQSIGSGVVVAADENVIYISTAAHCLKKAHTLVQFSDGSRCEAITAYVNEQKDVGFLLAPRAELAEETLAAITPAVGMDAQAAGKVRGDLLIVASSLNGPDTEFIPALLDQNSVPYPNIAGQNVLQFFSTASYGSSGGGVYTMEGIWVGSVSGGNTYGTCWAVSYSEIMNEFAVLLTQLAQQAAA